jgi:hypothetical protein
MAFQGHLPTRPRGARLPRSCGFVACYGRRSWGFRDLHARAFADLSKLKTFPLFISVSSENHEIMEILYVVDGTNMEKIPEEKRQLILPQCRVSAYLVCGYALLFGKLDASGSSRRK